jgi:sugar lactone lactonase YvrE
MDTLLEGGAFFEAPRWREGRWWVSDFYRHAVYTVTPEGEETEVVRVPGQPSGLGWLPDGSLLIVSMRDHRLLRFADGELSVHAEVGELADFHLNDMVVDRHGRAYVGNFGFDLDAGADPVTTSVVRVDPDGAVAVAADGFVFPNGMVITPDGRTLIVGETGAARYVAYTIGDDGSLSDRRVWAQIGISPPLTTFVETVAQLTFAPDGCGLDAEDHIWSANPLGAVVARIAPGGAIVEERRPPAGLTCLACMLGGDDGRTLLICAAPDFNEEARTAAREAVLLTTRVDVPHAGLP